MDVTATMDAPGSARRLFDLVDRLDHYPEWMPLTHRVQPAGTDPQGRPAWTVELRARMGPFARSKQLRMVRTVHESDLGHVRFERAELDARSHSPWVLDATVSTSIDGASSLVMRLHYGGALWTGGVMERVLADQIVAGRERLLELVGDRP